MPLVIAFFLGIVLQLGGIIPPPPPPGGSELYAHNKDDDEPKGTDGKRHKKCDEWYEESQMICNEEDDNKQKKCEKDKEDGRKHYYDHPQHNCQIQVPISIGLELFLFFTGLFLLYSFHQKRNLGSLQNT